MKCMVVTPEKTVIDVETTFVVLPLYDGEMGIGLGHTPLIGRLGVGELRITPPEGPVLSYYVEGGFAEVREERISLLTNRAIRSSELNVLEIQQSLEAAQARPNNTPKLAELKTKALQIAKAQLHLAQKKKSAR